MWPDESESSITLRVEAMTGLALDDQGEVRTLSSEEWSDRIARLKSASIPLAQPPRWSLDPVLYGPEPTSRAKAWLDRGEWAEAEAAFEEAVKARPGDCQIRWERGRFLAARSRPQQAANEFVEALRLNFAHRRIMEAFLKAGPDREEKLAAEDRAVAELSEEVLGSRAIADRVYALAPRDLFKRLHPIARARYFTASERWADAQAAYEEAIDVLRRGFVNIRDVSVEYSRFLVARGEIDKASDFLWMRIGSFHVPMADLSRAILSDPRLQDRFFAPLRKRYSLDDIKRFQGELLDAVFPSDPFAH
jgi:tetratricopeptide (TPR) repeat protein